MGVFNKGKASAKTAVKPGKATGEFHWHDRIVNRAYKRFYREAVDIIL